MEILVKNFKKIENIYIYIYINHRWKILKTQNYGKENMVEGGEDDDINMEVAGKSYKLHHCCFGNERRMKWVIE